MVSPKPPSKLMIDRAVVYYNGKEVPMPTGAMLAFRRLIENKGRFVSYQELYNAYKRKPFRDTRGGEDAFAPWRVSARTMVSRIRQCMRAVDPEWDGIETKSGYGVRWLG